MAKTRIIINRQKASENRKYKGRLPEQPTISIHQGSEVDYAYSLRLTGVYRTIQARVRHQTRRKNRLQSKIAHLFRRVHPKMTQSVRITHNSNCGIGQSHIKILLDGSANLGHCICLFNARGHRIRSFVHDFTHSLEGHLLNCWANHTKQRTAYAITVSITFTCDCPQLWEGRG